MKHIELIYILAMGFLIGVVLLFLDIKEGSQIIFLMGIFTAISIPLLIHSNKKKGEIDEQLS